MKVIFALLFAASAGALAAAPGGKLRTLERGRYECGTPGLAGERPVTIRPDLDLRIINGSSYRIGEDRGTYLHTGNRVVFTSGVLEGQRFRRISQAMIRQVDGDGIMSDLRCVRIGR